MVCSSIACLVYSAAIFAAIKTCRWRAFRDGFEGRTLQSTRMRVRAQANVYTVTMGMYSSFEVFEVMRFALFFTFHACFNAPNMPCTLQFKSRLDSGGLTATVAATRFGCRRARNPLPHHLHLHPPRLRPHRRSCL